MTKKVVTSDELERLMLAKIKEYSDCQNVKSITFYRMLEGDRSWTISSYDAEIPGSIMRKVDLELRVDTTWLTSRNRPGHARFRAA